MCPFLNASACEPTVEATRKGRGFMVALYNPLAWPRQEVVRVPITAQGTGEWAVSGGPTHGLKCGQKHLGYRVQASGSEVWT